MGALQNEKKKRENEEKSRTESSKEENKEMCKDII